MGVTESGNYTISTHALREEGDVMAFMQLILPFYFYPRPPRGGRLPGSGCNSRAWYISTHALREEGDLAQPVDVVFEEVISTHALREEGDANLDVPEPLGFFISTHALREEGDVSRWSLLMLVTSFLPTPSARRATANPTETPSDLQTT